MGYPQQQIQIKCDNKCAVEIANDDVKQKRSKAIDMRYHWIRDQVNQHKGETNLADFFTKAHPTKHLVAIRHLYVYTLPMAETRYSARERRVAKYLTKKQTT